ncbi:MAG: PspC domain-containing protein [Paludibacteraceae bacterium]|nr:PspC domain-containing protein [Paludibacteraceae bacterium]
MEKKLKRSANKMIAGVCGGLAEYLGMDATIVRVIYALLVLFGGVGILLYLILALLMPKAE